MGRSLQDQLGHVRSLPLRPEWVERFEGIVRLAEVDVRAAANQMRSLLEIVVREVYRLHVKEPTSKESLDQMIREGVSKGKFPQKLGGFAIAIKEVGNIGSHPIDERLDLSDLERTLDMLVDILAWHVGRPAAGDSPSGRAGGTAKEMPSLIPYVCDRTEQEYQIERAYVGGRGREPLVCVVHGDERQCHDKFVDRLRHETLPRITGAGRGQSAVDVYCLYRLPTATRNDEYAATMWGYLGREVVGDGLATPEVVLRAITSRDVPVVISCSLPLRRWDSKTRTAVNHFVAFWRDRRIAGLRFRPLVTLLVYYPAFAEGAFLAGLRRLRSKGLRRSFLNCLNSTAADLCAEGRLIVLDELLGLELEDLKQWSERREVRSLLNGRDIYPELCALRDRVDLRDELGRLAMERVALELKKLLSR